MDHIVKEAIEIQLHPKNFNREAGFTQSLTRQLVISLLQRSPPPNLTQPNLT